MARRWQGLAVAVAVALTTLASAVMSQEYHSPWLTATVGGIEERLVLSTRFHGIIIFRDVADSIYESVNVSFGGVTAIDVMVKVMNREAFSRPWNTTGFLGIGITSSPQPGWPFLNNSVDTALQYHGMDRTSGVANVTFGAFPDEVSWSESMNVVHDFYYKRRSSFTVHNVTTCGVPLLAPISSYWAGHIDFQVPCLILPKEFYDTLTAWAPVEYNASANRTQVRDGVSLADLPTLTFQTGLGSPLLSLRLQDLVLNNSNGSSPHHVCIERADSVVNLVLEHRVVVQEDDIFTKELGGVSYVPNMYQAPIVFGAMVLQHLTTVLSDSTKQIGFVSTGTRPVKGVCNAAVACTGDQTYHQAANECRDPNCNAVYFHELDTDTKTCVVSLFWQTVAGSVVAVFIVLEVFLERARASLAGATLHEHAS
ncbi:hypothetical protein ACHHYP_01960 [Achlya hypogyna]|uniref:Secreted protein n=1 Tax=Achlya hypogyna TaxID=1202772 RepID=A0A1V9ZTB0_ACHHY|nr:hypothetical protein ACHHYP_01960 [Achlya hypogyna]